MLTRVERVVIGVTDLEQAVHTYTRLGFELHASAESASAYNAEDRLELLPLARGERLAQGLWYILIESDDLAGDMVAMRDRGVDVGDGVPLDDDAMCAVLGPSNPLPLRFIQQRAPLPDRRPHICSHPNQVERLERTYIVVPNLLETVETYARVLGLPVPPAQRGNVIKADMCIFDVGPAGIGVAQPAEPGPAAAALESRGPGPFQVLYRTRSMRAGAEWMTTHGMPPPARGTRNTGEQAMLVGPEQACGTYVALVGPE